MAKKKRIVELMMSLHENQNVKLSKRLKRRKKLKKKMKRSAKIRKAS